MACVVGDEDADSFLAQMENVGLHGEESYWRNVKENVDLGLEQTQALKSSQREQIVL